MKKLSIIVLFTALLLTGCNNQAKVTETGIESPKTEVAAIGQNPYLETSAVEYFEGVTGYQAKPKNDRDYPGVVIIHEWWGLNNEIKAQAEMLAEEGFNVLAVDLYNGKIAKDPTEAAAFKDEVDLQTSIANMQAAVKFLEDDNSPKIAALGWCFGGAKSLELALSGTELDASVIYYGNLNTNKDELAKIKWPVLGIFGEEDAVVPVAQVKEFNNLLNELEITNEVYIYPGVGHAFANPTNKDFAPEETADAWDKTLNFLRENLNSI